MISTKISRHFYRISLPTILFSSGIVMIALGVMALSARVVAAPAEQDAPPELPIEYGQFFATSGVCADCHTNLKDEGGLDVSFDTAWRSTMMANSGRDPFWLAVLRREVLSSPDLAESIQDRCATCHMPMARTTINLTTGEDALILGEDGLTQPDHPLHALAVDGVSCTLCHQITSQNLGNYEGFSGGYGIDSTASEDERIAYGPFEPIPEHVAAMQEASGYVQTQSSHIQSSEVCATCHELYTPYISSDAETLARIEFAEQTPYSEWLNSDFKETHTCQSCHMPAATGMATVASEGDPLPAPRADVSKHTFIGANTYMLQIFQRFAGELGAPASVAQFQSTIELTRSQLQLNTAWLALENISAADGVMTVDVVLQNLAGHKLPTAFPSRRVWVHLIIHDEEGNIVFESGGYNQDGSIIGNDNDENGALYEPHYDVITSADEIQIYEAIVADMSGKATTSLLGTRYLKDNRMLPAGFDNANAPPKIRVYGEAVNDDDFIGGGDRVTYQIPLGDTKGTLKVEAELLYQSIAYRWVDDLRPFADAETAPEIAQFLSYYEAVPNIPEWIATAPCIIFTVE